MVQLCIYPHYSFSHRCRSVFSYWRSLILGYFYAKYQRELVDKEKKSNDLAGSRSEENLGHALCPLERQSDEAFISVSLLQSQTSEISTVSPGKHTPLPVRTIVSVMQPKDTGSAPSRALAMGIGCFKQETWLLFLGGTTADGYLWSFLSVY